MGPDNIVHSPSRLSGKVAALLNKALVMEYGDIFLYQRHVDYFAKYPGIGDLFRNFSQMETRHADLLSLELKKLGFAPTTDFNLIDAKKSIREIVNQHLKNEQGAVALYNQCLKVITDHRLADVIDAIRIEETIHQAALAKLIKWL